YRRVQASRGEEPPENRTHHDPRREGRISESRHLRAVRQRDVPARQRDRRHRRRSVVDPRGQRPAQQAARGDGREGIPPLAHLRPGDRMSIFKKCDAYTIARDAQAAGIYPYFVPIEESTATEARIDGKWRIMVG